MNDTKLHVDEIINFNSSGKLHRFVASFTVHVVLTGEWIPCFTKSSKIAQVVKSLDNDHILVLDGDLKDLDGHVKVQVISVEKKTRQEICNSI